MNRHQSPISDGRQLVAALMAAGGPLTVVAPTAKARATYRRAIWQARDEGLVPDGRKVRYTGRDRGEMQIWLSSPDDGPPHDDPPPVVPVPGRLAKPHPAVAATREVLQRRHRDEHGRCTTHRGRGVFDVRVSNGSVGRAMRILQGLVVELHRRGYKLTHGYEHGPVRIGIGAHAYSLRMVELLDRVEHQPTDSELAASQRPFGPRPPRFDYTPSQRLAIEFDSTSHGRRRRWSDTTRWTLEDKLAEALCELEQRAEIDQQRAAERERAAQQRQRERERELSRARTEMAEEWRADCLDQEIASWQRAEAIRAYCDRLEAAASSGSAAATWVWSQWARRYADRIDPTGRAQLPAVPEVPTVNDYQVETWLRTRHAAQPRATWR